MRVFPALFRLSGVPIITSPLFLFSQWRALLNNWRKRSTSCCKMLTTATTWHWSNSPKLSDWCPGWSTAVRKHQYCHSPGKPKHNPASVEMQLRHRICTNIIIVFLKFFSLHLGGKNNFFAHHFFVFNSSLKYHLFVFVEPEKPKTPEVDASKVSERSSVACDLECEYSWMSLSWFSVCHNCSQRQEEAAIVESVVAEDHAVLLKSVKKSRSRPLLCLHYMRFNLI